MNKKVCIFVDGENLRILINKLFPNEFSQEKYLPKTDWKELYSYIAKETTKTSHEIIRTYWYVIQYLDFFPYKFPDHTTETDKLKELLSKNKPYKTELENLTGQNLVSKMKDFVDNLLKEKEKMKKRFEGWLTIQNGISTDNELIEFRRAGANSYNLFKRSFGVEKAVDVKLAVDMIMLRDIYDIAIIVSGDQDYVPAVQIIKDFGKKVVNVSFETRDSKLLPGGSWRLNVLTDDRFIMKYDEFRNLLGFGIQRLIP